VTAVSEALRQETITQFSITRDIEVIPNFVDTTRYSRGDAAARARVASPETSIVSHVSNFRKVKRIPDVLQIFARIVAARPAVLLMVGDGPERPAAEALARQLGIEQDVNFLGKTTEVERILGISDVFLLPSETESFGLAALEAMASGAPVIASNAGGLPEVITHGSNGYLEPVGAIDAMADHAIALLNQPMLLAEFAESAQEAATTFSMDQIGDSYLNVYTRLLHG
jgi:N-acetyl-alpha-D-glucosaminyl L-malate synthase BshA